MAKTQILSRYHDWHRTSGEDNYKKVCRGEKEAMHGRDNQLRQGMVTVNAIHSKTARTVRGENHRDRFFQMGTCPNDSKTNQEIVGKPKEMVDFLKQRHDLFPIFKNERWQPLMIHSASPRTGDKLEAMSHDKKPGPKSVKDVAQTEILAAIFQHVSWLTYQQLAISQVNYLIKLSLNQNRGSLHS
ncbi:hypothetical protein ACWODI_06095 [Facklamia languida]